MKRWYPLEPTDDEFLLTAPVRTRKVLDVPVSTDTLWAALTADDAVASWSPGVSKVRWVGARPYGVGTIREVTVAGVATVREKFYRWDEGVRQTFSVVESSRPGFHRFAEDYVVDATPGGSRLTWTVAVEPSHLAQRSGFLGGPLLGLLIGSTVRGLRKQVLRGAQEDGADARRRGTDAST